MELKEMTIEEMEERKSAIVAELDAEGADLDALEAEMKSIKEEIEARKAEEEKKAEIRQAIVEGAGTVIRKFEEEKKEMTKTPEEIRSSKEYVDAFARYLISEDATECRALLTTDASGSVPVPVLVDEIIRTAWDNDEILSRVRKTNIRGNLKVAFELSADGAYVHTEGTSAPTEEALALGIVTMIPKNIKKWIHISDEAIAMGGETLVRYIYDELTYQIIKKLAALVVATSRSYRHSPAERFKLLRRFVCFCEVSAVEIIAPSFAQVGNYFVTSGKCVKEFNRRAVYREVLGGVKASVVNLHTLCPALLGAYKVWVIGLQNLCGVAAPYFKFNAVECTVVVIVVLMEIID